MKWLGGVVAATLLAVWGFQVWSGKSGAEPATPHHEPRIAPAEPRENRVQEREIGAARREDLRRPAAREAKTAARQRNPTGGLVVDVRFPDGSTAASVEVLVICEKLESTPAELQWDHDRIAGLAEASSTTGLDGRARFVNLAAGRVLVLARPFSVAAHSTVVEGKETEVALEIEGMEIEVAVSDRLGDPVEGASVFWCRLPSTVTNKVGITNSEGSLLIQGAPRDCGIRASKPGCEPSSTHVVRAIEGRRARVAIQLLDGGGRLEGIVLAPGGAGLPDVHVQVGPEPLASGGAGAPNDSGKQMTAKERTRTDAEGRFSFAGLCTGELLVEARASGTELAPWSGTTEVGATPQPPLRIELQPGASCRGVVSGADGHPVAGAYVRTVGTSWLQTASARADSDGSYELKGVQPGQVRLQAEDSRHRRASVTLQASPGQGLRWDAVLDSGAVLYGQVVDQEGRPVGGVSVKAGGRDWGESQRTDADGQFEIGGCPHDRPVALSVWRGLNQLSRQNNVFPAEEQIVIVVDSRKEGVSIEGCVTDADQNPVASAILISYREPGGFNAVHPLGSTDGCFLIEGLEPGYYTLFVDAGGFAQFRSVRRQLTGGETWDLGSIELTRGGSVRVDFVGAPADGAIVRLIDEDLNDSGRVVDNVSPLVPAGRYQLSVTGPAVCSQLVDVVVEPGKETHVSVGLVAGVRHFIQIDAEHVKKGDRVTMEVRNRDGVIVYVARVPFSAEGLAWSFGLATEGVISVESDFGLRGSLNLPKNATCFADSPHVVQLE